MTSTETTTTSSAAPVTASEGSPAAQSSSSVDWTAGLNEELKGYVANKGFKDPAMTVESYRNLEKLMGVPQDRLLKLPEKAEDKDGWNSIYNRLGRPEKADQYTLKGEGVDESTVKWAQETFHELGLTRNQAEKLYEKFNGFSGQNSKAAQEAQEASLKLETDKQEAALKKEWGADFDQRTLVAKSAAAKFGLDGPTIDAIEKQAGFAGVMKFLHAVGSSVGEDSFVSGTKGATDTAGSGPAAAQQRIKDLMTDRDFQSRMSSGGTNEKNEWNRLHVLAYSAE